jgi:hypothetical protein
MSLLTVSLRGLALSGSISCWNYIELLASRLSQADDLGLSAIHTSQLHNHFILLLLLVCYLLPDSSCYRCLLLHKLLLKKWDELIHCICKSIIRLTLLLLEEFCLINGLVSHLHDLLCMAANDWLGFKRSESILLWYHCWWSWCLQLNRRISVS